VGDGALLFWKGRRILNSTNVGFAEFGAGKRLTGVFFHRSGANRNIAYEKRLIRII